MGTEKVRFDCGGIKLAGVYHRAAGDPPRAAIVSHGFAGSKDSEKWLFVSEGLAREGFPVFRFDYSGIGESGGKFEDVTLTGRIAELRAASKFVMDYFGVREIAPIGSSFGGVTALYAANDPGVVCTVISSTPVDFEFFKSIENTTEDADGLLDLGGMKVKRALVGDVGKYDIAAQAARVSKALVVHGANDELVPPRHAGVIFGAAREPKELLMVDGADHAFTQWPHREIFLHKSLEWLKKFFNKKQR
jgi:uncharacterized protein